MSAALDYGLDPYYSQPVGPQDDGTVVVPSISIANQPVDAGGGMPGSYGQQVLDIFKFGVGAAAQSYQQRQLLDYKRWEATQFGPMQQGVPAYGVTAGGGGGNGGLLLLALIVGGVILVAAN